ncbi:T9SS type A sorting domain-containing protein [Pontibacter sp. H259]|uniref:T9SS type A sorting domain-containing protein n=1 Tax=Pontibacter sp. H259 TaxID=3133421 RepID=UPI0030C1D36A
MRLLVHYLFLLLVFAPLFVLAEGSRNLTPNTAGSPTNLSDPNNTRAGFLTHDANFASAAGVGPTSLSFLKSPGYSYNGATYSADHRLYVRVLPGETVHFGVHRIAHDQGTGNQNQNDLNITVKYKNVDGSGPEVNFQTYRLNRNTNSTRQAELLNTQAGVIDNALQASYGPAALNPNGYQSLGILNNSNNAVDFFFEFNQVNENSLSQEQRFSVYDFWDFTVLDANKVEKTGRLFSKLWAFSAGGTSNVFSKNFDMYPLIPSETQPGKYYVKILELAGIAPQNFFRFVTNSRGTNVGSTVEERRKSQTTNSDYPEYYNFVNDPDPAIWPTASTPTFSVDVQAYCTNSVTGRGGVTFTANSSESSTFMVLIDMNNNGTYEPGTADVLLEKTGPAGTKVITWDGLNGLGQIVAKNTTLHYYFKNGSGPVNFPVWDAETNLDGFRVGDVRPMPAGTPAQNYASKLYWDDSKLATSRFPAPQTQLFGASATGTYQNLSGGQHTWGSSNASAGDLYTVNTWSYGYTNETTFTHTYTYDCSVDLAVTNTASGGNYIIGKAFTYTVTILNNGPQLASGVVLKDLLNTTNLNFISATVSHGTYNSTTGDWTVGDMGSGATRTLTITASPKVIGTVNQTATITGLQQTDSNTNNNAATASINVVSAADIEVKNVVSGTTFVNGDEVTYTITAKNLGPNNATNVAITDLLPGTLTFVSATTASGAYNATTGVWSIGDLANGSTATLTLKALVNRIGAITTTAQLNSRTGAEVDENVSNNVSSNTINVTPAADVEITSTVSNPNPSQGDQVRITIRAKNNGPNEASGVVVTNTIPASFTLRTPVTGSTGTYNATNYTWNVGSIPVGTTHYINYDFIVNSNGEFTIVSTQSHTEPDAVSSNNTASSTITVSSSADVAVTNTISPVKAEYANGDQVTYTVTVSNNGPSTATNVLVTDKLPASLTYNSSNATTGSYNPATGNWTVGTLTSGATATLTITATINQSAVITTTATQTHTETDNVGGNNTASNTIRSGSGQVTADVLVEVLAPATPAYTGDEVVLTVKVTNTGPDAATGLSLDAVLIPTGMTLVNQTTGSGSYNSATGKWTIGNLASGATTELKLTVKPEPDTNVLGDKTYTFTAQNLILNEYQGTNTNKDTDQKTITVKKKADAVTTIAVTGDINGVFYNRLTEATFTITVTNAGPDVITNLVGTDTRTGFVTFTAVPIPSAGTTYSTVDGNWRIPVLNPGETKTLIVKGRPNRPGRLNLGGEVTWQDQYDPIQANNKAIALLNVLPVSDLNLTHTVTPGPYYNGQNVTYTVTLLNQGPDAATDVTIEEKLPAGLTFVSAVASMGTYDAASGIWTLGSDVLSTQSQTLTIVAKPIVTGTIAITTKVDQNPEFDHDASDNQATATIEVAKSADIRVYYSVPAGERNIGVQTSFTIEVSNLGPDATTNIAIQEALPAGLTYVNAIPSVGTYDPQNGIWNIPTLANGAQATLQMIVVPTKTGAITDYVYKISSDDYDPNGQNNQEGNNRTTILLNISDRAATYTSNPLKNFYDYKRSDVLAFPTDPDGSITSATLTNGATLPAGLQLENTGKISVVDPFLLRPGTYAVSISLSDEYGNNTTITNYTITINGDRDGDGVADLVDIDDNNDGITDLEVSGSADPYADDDQDGFMNYTDTDFMYPGNKAFADINGDGINDRFDHDIDGIINSLDIDIDNDGIPNAIEANGGVTPADLGYNAGQGILTGTVSANGMITMAQTGNNNGISKYSLVDTDRDGIKDLYDLDSDNDGLRDLMEGQTTAGYRQRIGLDADRDGLDDALDPSCGCTEAGVGSPIVNSDTDTRPDYLDTDSDDDLISDMIESFDDNNNGVSGDDLKLRAANFTNGYYPTTDLNTNKTVDWLDDDNNNGILNFQEPGHLYYRDTNGNGLVDLFDPANSGREVSFQLNNNSKMNYRDAAAIVPLPVSLIGFNATLHEEGVNLNWATASEQNNARFEVERSADGKNFTTIGSVLGAGNSNTRLTYTYLDTQLPLAVVYYRLKQVDVDGSYTYTKTIAVEGKKRTGKTLITLYPNPASEIVNLDLRMLPQGDYAVTIVSMDGRVVNSLKLQSGMNHKLAIGHLAAGKYIIRVQGQSINESHSLLKR